MLATADAFIELLAWAVAFDRLTKSRLAALRRTHGDEPAPAIAGVIRRYAQHRSALVKALSACSRGDSDLWAVFAEHCGTTKVQARKLDAAQIRERRRSLRLDSRGTVRTGSKGELVDSAREGRDAALAGAVEHVANLLADPDWLASEASGTPHGSTAASARGGGLTALDRAVRDIHIAREKIRDQTKPRTRAKLAVPTSLRSKLGKQELEVRGISTRRAEQLQIAADLRQLQNHGAVVAKRKGTFGKRGGLKNAAIMIVAVAVFGDQRSFRTVESASARKPPT